MSIDLLVAEGDKSENRVDEFLFFGRSGAAFGFEGGRATDLVFQFHDEAFGGFLADAAQGR